MLPLTLITQGLVTFLRGPLDKLLDGYIADVALKRKLAAELESQLLGAMTKIADEGAGIVMAEVKSEHWLTRSWRPLLMLLLMGFLVFVGLVLPLLDLIAGKPIGFAPRWQLLPPDFWNFLSIGMGGYIGGRSMEKVASLVFPKAAGKAEAKQ